jgi:hypothetical protein
VGHENGTLTARAVAGRAIWRPTGRRRTEEMAEGVMFPFGHFLLSRKTCFFIRFIHDRLYRNSVPGVFYGMMGKKRNHTFDALVDYVKA